MSANKTDISQIRKYLKGELDARAMHQLEREAQDDPFLMDALEGYETAGLQQSDLDDLDSRLARRITGKQRKAIPWMYLAAATVLVVFTLGYLLWPAGRQVNTKPIIAADKKPATDIVVAPLADTLLKPPAKDQMLAAIKPADVPRNLKSRVAVIAPTPLADAVTDNKMANEPAPASVYDKLKPDTPANLALLAKRVKSDNALKEITIRGYGSVKKSDVTSVVSSVQTNALQGKVAGVEVTTPEHLINGTIYDDLGRPLPGASIAVVGKQQNTVTDINGRFSLPADGKETLNIASIGYESKRVKAKANDSLNIALKTDNLSLSEVVVVGYGKFKKEPKEAHPKTGWDNYNNYLKNGATTNDGTSGNVRLSFTVSSKGQLSDFKVTKGLSEALDQQAIELVKNGPAWAPDASGLPKTIKLKIHFSKKL